MQDAPGPATPANGEWTFFEQLFHPDRLAAAVGIGLRVIIIFLLALAASKAMNRVATRWSKRVEHLPPLDQKRQRTYTVSNLVNSAVRYTVWVVALFMILSELHLNIGPLLASAGVAGLAIGFGAQTLVRDVISGIFLLFDETLSVGNVITVGPNTGVVEQIGLRLIKVRKFDGELLMVPAGELRTFGNKSRGFARAIVDVNLAYEQPIDDLIRIVERVAGKWADEHRKILLDDAPSVQAITSFGDSSINIRVVVKVIPGEQPGAERELRLRLKREFDRLGVDIPFPRRTIYLKKETPELPTSFPPEDDAPSYESDDPDAGYPG